MEKRLESDTMKQAVLGALARVREYIATLVDGGAFRHAFAFAVVGLSFKQLQGGMPVGPMELLALALALVALASGRYLESAASLRALVVSALVYAAVVAGTVRSLIVEPAAVNLRDTAAFSFTLLVVAAFIATAARREALALRALALVTALYCWAIAVLAFVPGLDMLWYDGVRLQGLSDNPNQIAFLALAGLGLLSLLPAAEPERCSSWFLALPGAGCVAAGILARSDAFLIGLVVIAACAGVALLPSVAAGVLGRPRSADAAGARRARTLLALALGGIFLMQGPQVTTMMGVPGTWVPTFGGQGALAEAPNLSLTRMLEAENGQGYDRLDLWSEAVRVFAAAPALGHGAGAHVPNAKVGGAPSEAHNTVLDFLVVSGLVGTTAITILVLAVVRSAWRAGRLASVLLAAAPLGTFAMAHFVGRQPLVWILLFGCACAAGVSASRRFDAANAGRPEKHASERPDHGIAER